MKNFNSLVEEYLIIREQKEALGFQIASKLRDVIEKYIPDIKCNEALCFFSDTRDRDARYLSRNTYTWSISLDDVINRVFPELKARCHLGVYMTSEEAKNLESDLKHLKESLIILEV